MCDNCEKPIKNEQILELTLVNAPVKHLQAPFYFCISLRKNKSDGAIITKLDSR